MWRTSSAWTSRLFVHTAANQTRDGRDNYGFRSSCYSSGHFPLTLRLPVWSSVSPADRAPSTSPFHSPPCPFSCATERPGEGEGEGEKEREEEPLLVLWASPRIYSQPQQLQTSLGVSQAPLHWGWCAHISSTVADVKQKSGPKSEDQGPSQRKKKRPLPVLRPSFPTSPLNPGYPIPIWFTSQLALWNAFLLSSLSTPHY